MAQWLNDEMSYNGWIQSHGYWLYRSGTEKYHMYDKKRISIWVLRFTGTTPEPERKGQKFFRFCIDFLSFLSKHSIPAYSLKINCIVVKLLFKILSDILCNVIIKILSQVHKLKKIAIVKTEKFFQIPVRLQSYLEEHYFIYFVEHVFPE